MTGTPKPLTSCKLAMRGDVNVQCHDRGGREVVTTQTIGKAHQTRERKRWLLPLVVTLMRCSSFKKSRGNAKNREACRYGSERIRLCDCARMIAQSARRMQDQERAVRAATSRRRERPTLPSTVGRGRITR